MIELKNLTKKYGAKTAVDNLSAVIEEGEIVGLLGPNGAGKTTTMNMCTGYSSSTSGTVVIDGYDILQNPEQAKRLIGYLPENPPLYQDMTVLQYLKFVYELKGVRLNRRQHLDDLMAQVKITDVQSRLIRNLSKGYKQRVGIAQALVGSPEILIFDEPTVGLDPNQINDIRRLIRDLGKKRTVIISSHILSEISAICNKVMILNGGRLLAYDTVEQITADMQGASVLCLRVGGEKQAVIRALGTINGIRTITVRVCEEKDALDYHITPKDGEDVRAAVLAAMERHHLSVLAMQLQSLTLDEIFRQLTSKKKKVRPEQKEEAQA